MPSADLSKTRELLQGVTAARSAHDNMQQRFSSRFSPEFNPFLFIGPREVSLSRVIAWLLDPTESHGQRSLFLEKFLQLLALDEPPRSLDQVCVQCEERVLIGRLDISIATSDMKVIIENKINAADGKDQINRYLRHLDTLSLRTSKVVYLSLDGREPSHESLEAKQREERKQQGQLVLWSYDGQLCDWLKSCAADCLSTKIRDFLEDFINYIDFMKGKVDFIMKDLIISDIMKSDDKIVSAFIISNLIGDLKASLFRKLVEDLSSITRTTAKMEGKSNKNNHGIRIGLGIPGLSFVLEFANTNYSNFAWGVSCDEKGQLQNFITERQKLLDDLGPGNTGDLNVWLWYQDSKFGSSFPWDWNNDPGPWVAIFDGSLTRKFADCYEQATQSLIGTDPIPV